jgi:hypothetical protein
MTIEYRSVCPFCRTSQTHATQIGGDEGPFDGDFSLCFACGEIGIFHQGGVRKPTATERLEAARNEILRTARMAWLLR